MSVQVSVRFLLTYLYMLKLPVLASMCLLPDSNRSAVFIRCLHPAQITACCTERNPLL